MSIKDFTIQSKLGQGAYSTVYKVQRQSDGEYYALKKVKLGNLTEKQTQNALNEVRILASINHPNIIRYKQAFLEKRNLCIVMEFANDGDLYRKITDYKKKKHYFDQPYIWKVMIQITRALKQLHSMKIFHRDLKSANVFLDGEDRAKLGDMNVSKLAENGLLYTQTGTPYYASPEVWKEQPYDSKSDIWSFGCVMYEMAALEVPFKAEDMEGLSNAIVSGKYEPIPGIYSKQLVQVITSMLQLKAKNRPTCEKMLKSNIIMRKTQQLQLEGISAQAQNTELMKTIYLPKKFHHLSDRLPKPSYKADSSASKINCVQAIRSVSNHRERTNTLPKLDRLLIRQREQPNKQMREQSQCRNQNALVVEGKSKNIEDIKITIPNRRDRIQEDIRRIYEGRHQINHSNASDAYKRRQH